MDHKVVEIDGIGIVLLDRLILDEADTKHLWQVIVSTFCDTLHRYDEWIGCENAQQARSFIQDYTVGSASEFLVRANEWYHQKLAEPANIVT